MREIKTNIRAKMNTLMKFGLLMTIAFGFALNTYSQTETDNNVIELFAIPSPDEILHYVNKDDLKFTSDVLNKTSNMDKYVTSRDQYLALGVYLADLAYCVSFNKTSNAIKYLNVIDELGGDLNIFPHEIDAIKERFANNLGNVDSLRVLYVEVYEVVMDGIFESSRFNHYTLVSAGTFVESLYLALNSSQLNQQSKDFNRRIGDQNYISQQLMHMYGKYLDKKTNETMAIEFGPFANAFDNYGSQAAPTSSQKRYDGAIVISKTMKESTTSKTLEELTKELNKLRTLWTKN